MAYDIDIGLHGGVKQVTIDGYTYVTKNNPANASGILKEVTLYLTGYGTAGLTIGTFYVVSGNTLKCRDSVYLPSFSEWGWHTRDVELEVEEGDYLGIRTGTRRPYGDDAGYGGIWRYDGEAIDPGDQADYAFYAGYNISISGQGDAVAAGGGPYAFIM